MAHDLVSRPGQTASFMYLPRECLPAFYEPFRRFLNDTVGYSSTDQVPWISLIAGASSGAVGGGISLSGTGTIIDLAC